MGYLLEDGRTWTFDISLKRFDEWKECFAVVLVQNSRHKRVDSNLVGLFKYLHTFSLGFLSRYYHVSI